MINLTDKYFLQIEPDKEGLKSEEPVNDLITNCVQALYDITTKSGYMYKGFHTTKCKKNSDPIDHILPNGMITNSLCVYYVQYYRPYIPESEIQKIKDLSKIYLHVEL